ncbi:ATP-binding cassette domain-containing protein [Mesorhizobium retamae]|uniref:ATP-binding cassette domain-containing protein n=1 Tax=Mesorhizobium retamae TaxID=2912854 RepID=A0ABS9QIP6_9HYPH|nr:ATP-binding cassette domain-containing protein [Mesorhizobium sp. IRAMC:0171]MCG7507333.1 ATP-binding cassette domain-containing protein [Mesorhizobium sp. IRAMC:0171]
MDAAKKPDLHLYDVEAASFAVGGRTILPPLTMALEPGRFYGLVGPNGSGKSTLLKLLARQQEPAAGSIRFSGRPLDSYGTRDFARCVAYMPQFTPPAEGMNVRELAGLGRFPWHGALGRFSAEDEDKVTRALAQTSLTALAERMVDSLSGGERQRAWLAMMLAQDTRCLLLDEPTSALDLAHQVEILALVRKLSHKQGLTIVAVLHDINMAASFCDELIALRDGRIVARGAPELILEPTVLDSIYGLPMGITRHPQTGAPISYVL